MLSSVCVCVCVVHLPGNNSFVRQSDSQGERVQSCQCSEALLYGAVPDIYVKFSLLTGDMGRGAAIKEMGGGERVGGGIKGDASVWHFLDDKIFWAGAEKGMMFSTCSSHRGGVSN